LVSTLSGLFPGSALFSWVKLPGVPVKDYIIQAALFVVAAFILLRVALMQMRAGRSRAALGYAAWGCAFLVNIVFIVTSRTALVTVPVLLLVFAIRCFNWKGVCGVLALGAVLAAALWVSSDNMRTRLGNLNSEIEQYRVSNELTSAGQRMEFWKKSVGFITEAPVLGHGTGTIKSLFARSASAGKGASAVISTNPHNQFLTVAVQVGFAGGLLLIAMWIAHLLLFVKEGLAAWIGLVVVTQNIVGSLFNSHLADFSNGWLYVFGAGIAGGVVMARRESATRS
jgi:O-antigen ligase